MLNLENITLFTIFVPWDKSKIDSQDFQDGEKDKTIPDGVTESIKALYTCMGFANFKEVKFVTSKDVIDQVGKDLLEDGIICEEPSIPVSSMKDYSKFMIYHLNEYINTDFAITIQHDGFIINPDAWRDEFLNYDYIGAPWPIEESWINQQLEEQRPYLFENLPKNRVGNGGFCLRSRKFLEFSAQYDSCNNLGEDSFLCTRKYKEAIEYGIKFAPFELAVKFSYENPCIEFGTHWNQQIVFDKSKHFGWHGKNFLNTQELMSLKYT